MRSVLTTFLATILVLAIGIVVFIYSGTYNVAATAPHSALGSWILHTTKHRSIRAHAEGIDVPAIGGEQLQHGIEHFNEMCIACHGAPGIERGELGKGLTPTPPDLDHAAEEWTAAELFWIVKHGVKLAGMPAFGATHSDEELWGIVSFVQQLPEISPDEYRQLTAKLSQGHPHGHGEQPTASAPEAAATDTEQHQEAIVEDDHVGHQH